MEWICKRWICKIWICKRGGFVKGGFVKGEFVKGGFTNPPFTNPTFTNPPSTNPLHVLQIQSTPLHSMFYSKYAQLFYFRYINSRDPGREQLLPSRDYLCSGHEVQYGGQERRAL